MKPKKKPRVRKPEDLWPESYLSPEVTDDSDCGRDIALSGYADLTAKEARILSAWLLKAAAYLESKERG